ncbi:P-type conjugative transfer protein VirB9 [Rickettsiales bacterium]|nr:P-type conjugative transfer protein VirB9 [Rickettsiales bacterium]
MRILFIVLSFLCATFPIASQAVQTSRPLPVDSRLRTMTYHPKGIHKYVGFYDYQASIVFEKGERIETITMGYTNGWELQPSGNRLFIKPIADDVTEANTNMLIITNKRVYHFILEAREADGMDDPDLVWETRFVYPDSGGDNLQQFQRTTGPDLSQPEKYNFNYTLSGSEYIAPIRIFDDGEFTYFQFSKKNVDVPSFFMVDSAGREALINYRFEGDYVIVERVASQFTLRNGPDVTCVFNESRPLKKQEKKKKKGFF